MNHNRVNWKRLLRGLVCLALSAALVFALAACKEEGDIVPGPTAKPEQPTVIVNNEATEPEHTVSVSGYGEVIAEPDFSTITIIVTGTSATSEEAAANCEAAAQKVKEIAGLQNVLPKNLTMSEVALSTNTRESDGAVTGYVARATITIVVSNVSLVNTILSPIIDARIIESYEVTYSLLDASAAYEGALAAAMADAQAKAESIATAGGVVLGAVASVIEQPVEGQLVGVAFKSSSIAVSANLTVTYLIKGVLPQTQD
ncbi:MAG: SIMPL domain-containing protein [Clostridiales bacterium]|nr:SIMPL domain-containing protein [Clostridiales bacterium]